MNYVVLECQEKNKINKERDKCKHSVSRNKTNWCVVVILKESDAVQSLGKPDKIEFLIEPKQTELAKHRSFGAHIMQTNMMIVCH